MLVGDGGLIDDYVGVVGEWSNRIGGDQAYQVVPVCPTSAKSAFLAQLAPWFSLNKVVDWDVTSSQVVPDILNAAEIAQRDYRVFISYYQGDGRKHADDLHAALSKRGFDVFLDRISIGAGQSIPQRIREEIAHKSVLVVLETPEAAQSAWISQELAIAAAHRLGIVAVAFPNGSPLPSVSRRRRHGVKGSDFDRNGRLTSLALDDIVNRVAAVHDFTVLRRRYQMQRALSHALTDRGLTNHRVTPHGWLDVVPSWQPPTVCSIRVAPRLAELSDFRDLEGSLAPGGAWRRAVIAPGMQVAGQRQSDMRWLSGLGRTALFDEGSIRQVAQLLADPLRSALR